MNSSEETKPTLILPRREEAWGEFGNELYGGRMFNRGLEHSKEMLEKQGFTVYFLDEVESK